MNKVYINPKTGFEDSFDRVIIKDGEGSHFVFDCDSHSAPDYKVALFIGIEDNKEIKYRTDCLVWESEFFARDGINKRGVLCSMLTVLESEESLYNPLQLQQKFGGQINGFYKTAGEA